VAQFLSDISFIPIMLSKCESNWFLRSISWLL